MPDRELYTLDSAPLSRFHCRLAVYTLGGSFIDGYILGIIEFAMVLLIPALHINALWQGLIGSSPLIGIFLGALLFGRLADTLGRKKLYALNFFLIAVMSLLQLFAVNSASLFAIRVVLGVAVGADYAIGPSLQSEFMPIKYRAPLLSILNIAWTFGYFSSAMIGYLFSGHPGNWKWLLTSSALPAILFFLVGIGIPESPRWLISQGRVEEAQAVVKKYLGAHITIGNLQPVASPSAARPGYRQLFGKEMWRRTLFCCIFWSVSVIAFFPIFTYAPQILQALNIENELLVSLGLNTCNLLGAIAGAAVIDRVPRRHLLVSTYAASAVLLALLAAPTGAPNAVLVPSFFVFIFVFTIGGTLQYVYPSELFPTRLRASGIGFCSAMSRIASAFGTFVLPGAMAAFGARTVLAAMAVLVALSIITSLAWGPETRNQSLS